MAKISISKILGYRKKIRVMTVLACLILVAALGGILVSKYPRNANAAFACTLVTCTIDGSGYIQDNYYHPDTGGSYDLNSVPRDIYITGNITVRMFGHNTLKSLTVQNNATLTHDALNPGEDINSSKGIDINTTGDITIESGGKINVDGKGYHGGDNQKIDGYGPGGGGYGYISGNNLDAVGGGGGNGGAGGAGGGANNAGTGGVAYNYNANPSLFDFGSGGGNGYSVNGPNNNQPGGFGGGRVRLVAGGSINIDANTSISANGASGGAWGGNHGAAAGGGGSGGTIILNSSKVVFSALPNFKVTGGPCVGNGTCYAGSDGRVNFTNPYPVNNSGTVLFNAIGGKGIDDGGGTVGNSGGGGGGYIYITGSLSMSCRIVASGVDYIPAECENDDVIIDNTTVYADKVAVWQPQADGTTSYSLNIEEDNDPGVGNPDVSNWVKIKCTKIFGCSTRDGNGVGYGSYYFQYTLNAHSGDECSFNTQPLCDTKRHFASLAIQNNGVLTHQAVDSAEIGVGNTIANSTTGTGRWKKVAIATDGNITVASGAKINVDGKGYPGAPDGANNLAYDGYGPGRGKGKESNGGGGGFGGTGGVNPAGFGVTYPNNFSTNFSDDMFEFGSGGGGAYGNGDCATHTHSGGGDGGGRVSLQSIGGKIALDPTSQISANGSIGIYGVDSNSCPFSARAFSHGGGGSGGSIWLQAIDYDFPVVVNISSVDGANTSGQDNPSGVLKVRIVGTTTNLFANGGAGNSSAGGGGGGRIVVKVTGQSSVSIKKTLEAVSRNGVSAAVAPFNPYALQSGDVIKVNIWVSNLFGNIDLQDEYLKTGDIGSPGTKVCSFSGFNSRQMNGFQDHIVFPAVTPAEAMPISYRCQVN